MSVSVLVARITRIADIVHERCGITPDTGLGYVEGVTHDYRRHRTTTLFAALDTAKGKVLTKCRPRPDTKHIGVS